MNDRIYDDAMDIIVCRLYGGKRVVISPDTEEVIASYLGEICQRVKNYCHIDELPDELCDVVAAMTVEIMKSEGVSFSENGIAMALDSIRLGDARFDFSSASSVSEAISEEIINNYLADLHAYRRMAL